MQNNAMNTIFTTLRPYVTSLTEGASLVAAANPDMTITIAGQRGPNGVDIFAITAMTVGKMTLGESIEGYHGYGRN